MKTPRILFFIASTFIVGAGAILACGGSTEDPAAVPSGSSTSTSGGSTTSSTSGGSTTSSGGGSSTSSSGGVTDGSATTDGSTNTDGGTSSGASSGTPNSVTCGTATCNTTTQKCCSTFQQGMGIVQSCVAKAADCQGGEQSCDDKTDCPAGQICCAGGGPGGGFGASCQTTCNGIQICKAANECTDGGTCQTYTCFNRQVSLCRKPQFGCN